MIYASFCFNFPQNVFGAYSTRQTQRSATDKNVGGGGGTTSASAFSLGHHRKNPKKVENRWRRPFTCREVVRLGGEHDVPRLPLSLFEETCLGRFLWTQADDGKPLNAAAA